MPDFYLVRWLRNDIESFCIWYTDDKDGFICNEEKKIVCFLNKDSALRYLSQENLCLKDDKFVTYDIDKLRDWISSDDVAVDCKEILNFWNIFTDVAYTAGTKFKGDKENKLIRSIYEKLFYGNNIHAVKPEGEEDYIPVWDKRQVKLIKSIMKNGLNTLGNSIIYLD